MGLGGDAGPYAKLEDGRPNGNNGNGRNGNGGSRDFCDDSDCTKIPTYAVAVLGALGLLWLIAPVFSTLTPLVHAWQYLMAPTDDEYCEDGLLIPGPLPSPGNVILYMSLLLWSFIGVAIAADIFMVAIEYITSQTVTKRIETPNGPKPMTIYIWNATVANLTLMALGSSAPEILLSIIEIVSSGFYAGALGPSTIVGSAAFNLLGISAVCVLAIPAGQTRYIKETMVFFCTAFFSVFAYAWLYVILVIITPNIVDVWEGMMTLLLFPLLVLLAYAADIKVCQANASKTLLDVNKYGKGVSKDDVVLALKNSGFANVDPEEVDPSVLSSVLSYALAPSSRAYYRVNATRGGLAGKKAVHDDPDVQAALEVRGAGGPEGPPTLGFQFGAVTVQEGGKNAVLRVLLSRPVAQPVSVKYATLANGNATAGVDFVPVSGTLLFPPGATKREVRVPIIDDDEAEDDETFDVVLSDVHGAKLGEDNSVCTVTIEDDDQPGKLDFAKELVECAESCGTLNVSVKRLGGSKGTITVEYATKDGTAVAPSDYGAVEGTLTFLPGVVEQTISIEIVDDARYEADETFQIILTEPGGGGAIHDDADGFEDGRAICTVTIGDDRARAEVVDSISSLLDLNVDNIELAASTWRGQFRDAVEYEGEGAIDMLIYALSLPWKVIFAGVPPPRLGGGWLCFVIALVGIGALTALIGDLASHMGCCMGLLPSVTAITFVALGTSLPDTFASAQAAVKEMYADASIGNITGSNSVNVFLGLGLPWAAAAFYWAAPSESAAAAWHARYSSESWYVPGMPVGFAVPAGDLGFSVGVFCSCAVLCIAAIVARRVVLGAELGGDMTMRYVTAVFFVCLWAIYIGASAMNAYGML